MLPRSCRRRHGLIRTVQIGGHQSKRRRHLTRAGPAPRKSGKCYAATTRPMRLALASWCVASWTIPARSDRHRVALLCGPLASCPLGPFSHCTVATALSPCAAASCSFSGARAQRTQWTAGFLSEPAHGNWASLWRHAAYADVSPCAHYRDGSFDVYIHQWLSVSPYIGILGASSLWQQLCLSSVYIFSFVCVFKGRSIFM